MCLNGIMRKKVYNIDGNKKMSFSRTFRSLYKKNGVLGGIRTPDRYTPYLMCYVMLKSVLIGFSAFIQAFIS